MRFGFVLFGLLLVFVFMEGVSAQQVFLQVPSGIFVNDSFVVNVSFSGGDLSGAEFVVAYNNSLFSVENVSVGSAFSGVGPFLVLPSNLSNAVDAGNGSVGFAVALVGNHSTSGGVIAGIVFSVNATGNASFELNNVSVADSGLNVSSLPDSSLNVSVTVRTNSSSCQFGGTSICGLNFCCGVSDGVCPRDFGGVSCSVTDSDCSVCEFGGATVCGVDYCCGESDGVCPSVFGGISCSINDEDC